MHADQLGFHLFSCNVRLNNFLACILLVVLLLRKRFLIFVIDRNLGWGLIALAFSLLMSWSMSFDFLRSTIFTGWFGFTIIHYLFLPIFLIQTVDLKNLFKIYGFSFIAVGLYALTQFILSTMGILDPFADQVFGDKNLARPNAFAYEPSYYALYMTPFVMMVNLFYLLEKKRELFFGKLTLPIISLANFLYLISTSTSVIFAYGVFTGVLFIFTFYSFVKKSYAFLRRSVLQFIGLILLVFLFLWISMPTFSQQFFLKFFFKGMAHHSFYERWDRIIHSWQIFQENPFFGIGLGSIPSFLLNLWQMGELPMMNPTDFFSQENVLKLFEPSNVFTEVLASLGIFGLGAFLYIFWIYFRAAKEAILKSTTNEERDVCFVFLVSMIVTLIVLQFNQGILRSYVWVHFGLTFGYFLKIIGHAAESNALESSLIE